MVDRWNVETRIRLEHLTHPIDVPGLLAEVELALQRLRKVLEDRRHIDHLPERRSVLGLLREQLEEREVLHDVFACRRALHLHHDPASVRERRSVHLRDRSSGHGRRFDRLEHVLPRHPELFFHDPNDLCLGERRNVVLQRRQLFDELRRQQVWSRRQDLPELGERRTELFHRRADPFGLPSAVRLRVGISPLEQFLQAVLRHHRRDPRRSSHQSRFDRLGLGREASGVRGPGHRGGALPTVAVEE
jgi:hypothetical protein